MQATSWWHPFARAALLAIDFSRGVPVNCESNVHDTFTYIRIIIYCPYRKASGHASVTSRTPAAAVSSSCSMREIDDDYNIDLATSSSLSSSRCWAKAERIASETGSDQSLRRDLNLDRSAMLVRTAGNDHQIAALQLRLSLHDLPDRADCIDDRGTRRIGRECRQRLQDAAAIRPLREREHVGMVRLEPCGGGLQHLQQPLIEQRDAGGRSRPASVPSALR